MIFYNCSRKPKYNLQGLPDLPQLCGGPGRPVPGNCFSALKVIYPFWINGLLIGSAVLFILNDVLGFIFVMKPVKENNLKHSLSVLYLKLKRLAFFSIMSSLFFGSSVILFFTSAIQFTNSKYLMLADMVITMLIMIFLSYKNWAQRIGHVRRMQLEFEGVL